MIWSTFWRRRRMKRMAKLLIAAQEAKPQLLSYLESLEAHSESQARELKALRWTMTSERCADVDAELDQRVRRHHSK